MISSPWLDEIRSILKQVIQLFGSHGPSLWGSEDVTCQVTSVLASNSILLVIQPQGTECPLSLQRLPSGLGLPHEKTQETRNKEYWFWAKRKHAHPSVQPYVFTDKEDTKSREEQFGIVNSE